MSLTAPLQELRSRIDVMQGRSIGKAVVPVPEALAPLFPAGGLRAGSAYRIEGSNTLLAAFLAAASRSGAWCAVVGAPELGPECVAAQGADLGRLVLVPQAGRQWLSVLAALADAVAMVVVRPEGKLSAADAARLSARLRQHECALIALGPWPQAEAVLSVSESEWSGIGRGHGRLGTRRMRLSLRDRGGAGRPRTALLAVTEDRGEQRLEAVAAVSPAVSALPFAREPLARERSHRRVG